MHHHSPAVAAALALLVAISLHVPTYAKDPDCTGVERWATSMAFVHLKNAGLATNDELDLTKTKTVRLASERVGEDLYRQVHYVAFTKRSGGTIEVVTSNNASSQECSMSGVQIFVVSRRLGSE